MEATLSHGEWTNPWQPPEIINPQSDGEWRSESNGVLTGTEGSIRFSIGNGQNKSVYVHWNNPYDGSNKYHQIVNSGFEIYKTGGIGDNTIVEFFLKTSVPHFVSGFTPGKNGFHFNNTDFKNKNIPYSLPPLRGSILDLKYGNANNGLCGGMVYTVRDFFESSGIIPETKNIPLGEQDPLFIYIVNRLFDSFTVDDVSLYLKYMNPLYPDTDENIANTFNLTEGRAFIMANVEFPLIRQDILEGHLSPIGLILIKSTLPTDLGKNHQVLAYGYQMNGDDVTIFLYDPNSPNNDSIKLSFNAGSTANKIEVTHNVDAKGYLNCFFRTNYSYKKPDIIEKYSLRIFANVHHINSQLGFKKYKPKIFNFRNLFT